MPIPFNIRLGPAAPSGEIRNLVHHDTIRLEEAGTFESTTASLEIRDKNLAYTAMRGEWHLSLEWRPTGEEMFRGVLAEQLGGQIARRGGLGIAPAVLDQIIRLQQGNKP